MGQRDFNQSRNLDSPFGKESIFHTFFEDEKATLIPKEDQTEDNYFYTLVPCDSGLEVFQKYDSGSHEAESKEVIIIFERSDKEKSNFFGTACRVVMGVERKQLFEKLLGARVNISFFDEFSTSVDLSSWAERIAFRHKGTINEFPPTALENAIKLELINQSSVNQALQKIMGLNNSLADWMRQGIEVMDDWVLDEKNYELSKYGEKLKPIIPLQVFKVTDSSTAPGSTKNIHPTGQRTLNSLAGNFEKIVFSKAFLAASLTPGTTDDALVALTWLIRQYLEIDLPPRVKAVLVKAKEIILKATDFVKSFGQVAQEIAGLYNAFLSGLINGVISLLQTVLWLVAFLVENNPLMELERFTPTEIAKHQEKLEFVEELVDLVRNDISSIFDGLKKTVANIGEGIASFVEDVSKKIKESTKYFLAYIVGAIAFEVIVDAVIAFFTGGTSLAGDLASKIARLANEVKDKGIQIIRKTGAQIAKSAKSLYEYVLKEFQDFIEAIGNGNLLQYLKQKILQLFTGDIDDIISILPENKLGRSASRNRITKINNLLKKSTAIFNPDKPALKKLGVKLFKSANGLSVDFSKTPKYLFGGKVSKKSVVRIKLKGTRTLDFKTAWKKAGFSKEEILELADKFTWHHLDDFDPVTGEATMQLVDTFIHGKSRPHIGSVKQVMEYFNLEKYP